MALYTKADAGVGANESYHHWWEYTKAYDEMIRATDSPHAPWWIVDSNDKRAAHQLHYTHPEVDPIRAGRVR